VHQQKLDRIRDQPKIQNYNRIKNKNGAKAIKKAYNGTARKTCQFHPGKNPKYKSKHYNFNVMTKQEKDILFQTIKKIEKINENEFKVTYKPF